jgi:hypothetical protein
LADLKPSRIQTAGVTLLAALYALFQENERCGELDSAVDGDRVWMACGACGAVINRLRTMIDQRGWLLRSAVVC